MKVKELKSREAVPEIELVVVSKGEVRQWANERGSGSVCNCAGKDDSGEIKITLWNEQAKQVSEGDKIKISNGWCSEYNGEKQVSTGKQGSLEVLK